MRRAQRNIRHALCGQSRADALGHKIGTCSVINMLQLTAATVWHMAAKWRLVVRTRR
jgi:hypothetical protein